MRQSIWLKFTAGVLVFFFMVNDLGRAAPALDFASLTQSEIPLVSHIDIPPEMATLEDWYESPKIGDNRLLLHIQDAHAQPEAQARTRDLIQYLNKKYGIKTVFVEGAAEQLDTKWLPYADNMELRKKWIEAKTASGELSGTDLALLDQIPVKALPIETVEGYRNGYQKLHAVFAAEAEVKSFLDFFDSKFDLAASQILDEKTRAILTEWKKFEAGHREFLPYVKSLSKLAKENLNLDFNALYSQIEWPQMTRLLALQRLEKELAAVRPEAGGRRPEGSQGSALSDLGPRTSVLSLKEEALVEKQQLIESLKSKNASAGVLQGLERLDEKNLNLNRITAGDGRQFSSPRQLLEQLVEETRRLKIDLRQYPAFLKYAGYIVVRGELQPSGLFKEIEKLFNKMLNRLVEARSPEAGGPRGKSTRLIEIYHDSILLRKLLNLELSRTEWQKALRRKERLQPEQLTQRLKSLEAPVSGLRPDQMPTSIRKAFDNAFAFYDASLAREKIFFDKIQSAMSSSGLGSPVSGQNRIAILVTGGFHTEGLNEFFREKEISYGTLTPRLMNIESPSLYRNAMLRGQSSGLSSDPNGSNQTPVDLLMSELTRSEMRRESLRVSVAASLKPNQRSEMREIPQGSIWKRLFQKDGEFSEEDLRVWLNDIVLKAQRYRQAVPSVQGLKKLSALVDGLMSAEYFASPLQMNEADLKTLSTDIYKIRSDPAYQIGDLPNSSDEQKLGDRVLGEVLFHEIQEKIIKNAFDNVAKAGEAPGVEKESTDEFMEWIHSSHKALADISTEIERDGSPKGEVVFLLPHPTADFDAAVSSLGEGYSQYLKYKNNPNIRVIALLHAGLPDAQHPAYDTFKRLGISPSDIPTWYEIKRNRALFGYLERLARSSAPDIEVPIQFVLVDHAEDILDDSDKPIIQPLTTLIVDHHKQPDYLEKDAVKIQGDPDVNSAQRVAERIKAAMPRLQERIVQRVGSTATLIANHFAVTNRHAPKALLMALFMSLVIDSENMKSNSFQTEALDGTVGMDLRMYEHLSLTLNGVFPGPFDRRQFLDSYLMQVVLNGYGQTPEQVFSRDKKWKTIRDRGLRFSSTDRLRQDQVEVLWPDIRPLLVEFHLSRQEHEVAAYRNPLAFIHRFSMWQEGKTWFAIRGAEGVDTEQLARYAVFNAVVDGKKVLKDAQIEKEDETGIVWIKIDQIVQRKDVIDAFMGFLAQRSEMRVNDAGRNELAKHFNAVSGLGKNQSKALARVIAAKRGRGYVDANAFIKRFTGEIAPNLGFSISSERLEIITQSLDFSPAKGKTKRNVFIVLFLVSLAGVIAYFATVKVKSLARPASAEAPTIPRSIASPSDADGYMLFKSHSQKWGLGVTELKFQEAVRKIRERNGPDARIGVFVEDVMPYESIMSIAVSKGIPVKNVADLRKYAAQIKPFYYGLIAILRDRRASGDLSRLVSNLGYDKEYTELRYATYKKLGPNVFVEDEIVPFEVWLDLIDSTKNIPVDSLIYFNGKNYEINSDFYRNYIDSQRRYWLTQQRRDEAFARFVKARVSFLKLQGYVSERGDDHEMFVKGVDAESLSQTNKFRFPVVARILKHEPVSLEGALRLYLSEAIEKDFSLGIDYLSTSEAQLGETVLHNLFLRLWQAPLSVLQRLVIEREQYLKAFNSLDGPLMLSFKETLSDAQSLQGLMRQAPQNHAAIQNEHQKFLKAYRGYLNQREKFYTGWFAGLQAVGLLRADEYKTIYPIWQKTSDDKTESIMEQYTLPRIRMLLSDPRLNQFINSLPRSEMRLLPGAAGFNLAKSSHYSLMYLFLEQLKAMDGLPPQEKEEMIKMMSGSGAWIGVENDTATGMPHEEAFINQIRTAVEAHLNELFPQKEEDNKPLLATIDPRYEKPAVTLLGETVKTRVDGEVHGDGLYLGLVEEPPPIFKHRKLNFALIPALFDPTYVGMILRSVPKYQGWRLEDFYAKAVIGLSTIMNDSGVVIASIGPSNGETNVGIFKAAVKKQFHIVKENNGVYFLQRKTRAQRQLQIETETSRVTRLLNQKQMPMTLQSREIELPKFVLSEKFPAMRVRLVAHGVSGDIKSMTWQIYDEKNEQQSIKTDSFPRIEMKISNVQFPGDIAVVSLRTRHMNDVPNSLLRDPAFQVAVKRHLVEVVKGVLDGQTFRIRDQMVYDNEGRDYVDAVIEPLGLTWGDIQGKKTLLDLNSLKRLWNELNSVLENVDWNSINNYDAFRTLAEQLVTLRNQAKDFSRAGSDGRKLNLFPMPFDASDEGVRDWYQKLIDRGVIKPARSELRIHFSERHPLFFPLSNFLTLGIIVATMAFHKTTNEYLHFSLLHGSILTYGAFLTIAAALAYGLVSIGYGSKYLIDRLMHQGARLIFSDHVARDLELTKPEVAALNTVFETLEAREFGTVKAGMGITIDGWHLLNELLEARHAELTGIPDLLVIVSDYLARTKNLLVARSEMRGDKPLWEGYQELQHAGLVMVDDVPFFSWEIPSKLKNGDVLEREPGEYGLAENQMRRLWSHGVKNPSDIESMLFGKANKKLRPGFLGDGWITTIIETAVDWGRLEGASLEQQIVLTFDFPDLKTAQAYIYGVNLAGLPLIQGDAGTGAIKYNAGESQYKAIPFKYLTLANKWALVRRFQDRPLSDLKKMAAHLDLSLQNIRSAFDEEGHFLLTPDQAREKSESGVFSWISKVRERWKISVRFGLELKKLDRRLNWMKRWTIAGMIQDFKSLTRDEAWFARQMFSPENDENRELEKFVSEWIQSKTAQAQNEKEAFAALGPATVKFNRIFKSGILRVNPVLSEKKITLLTAKGESVFGLRFENNYGLRTAYFARSEVRVSTEEFYAWALPVEKRHAERVKQAKLLPVPAKNDIAGLHARSQAMSEKTGESIAEIWNKFGEIFPEFKDRFALMATGSDGRVEMTDDSDIEGRIITDIPFSELQSKESDANEAATFLTRAFHTILRQGWITVEKKNFSDLSSDHKDYLKALTVWLDARFLYGNRDIFDEHLKEFRTAFLWNQTYFLGSSKFQISNPTFVEMLKWLQTFLSRILRFQVNLLRINNEAEGTHRREFLEAAINAWNAAYVKEGHIDAAFGREPDLKNHVGGLRAMHFARWIMQAVTGSLKTDWDKFKAAGLVRQDEVDSSLESYHFILRVRNAFATVNPPASKRTELTLSMQPKVAELLGYGKGAQAIEEFRKDYLKHTQNLLRFSTRVIRRAYEKADSSGKTSQRETKEIARFENLGARLVKRKGWIFSFERGFLKEPHQALVPINGVIEPAAILPILRLAVKKQVPLSGTLWDQMVLALPAFQIWLRDDKNRKSAMTEFMEILAEPKQISATLLRLHMFGILPILFPALELTRHLQGGDLIYSFPDDLLAVKRVQTFDYMVFQPEKVANIPEQFKSLAMGLKDDREKLAQTRLALLMQSLERIQSEESVKVLNAIFPAAGDVDQKSVVLRLMFDSHLMSMILRLRIAADPAELDEFLRMMRVSDSGFWRLLLLQTLIHYMQHSPERLPIYFELLEGIDRIPEEYFAQLHEEDFLLEEKNTVAGNMEKEARKVRRVALLQSLIDQNRKEFLADMTAQKDPTKPPQIDSTKPTSISLQPLQGTRDLAELVVFHKQKDDKPGKLKNILGAVLLEGLEVWNIQVPYSDGNGFYDRLIVRMPNGDPDRMEQEWARVQKKLGKNILMLLNQEPGYQQLMQRIENIKIEKPDQPLPVVESVDFFPVADGHSTWMRVIATDRLGWAFGLASLLVLRGINIEPRTTFDTEGYAAKIGSRAVDYFQLTKNGHTLTAAEQKSLGDDLKFLLEQKVITVQGTFPNLPSQRRSEMREPIDKYFGESNLPFTEWARWNLRTRRLSSSDFQVLNFIKDSEFGKLDDDEDVLLSKLPQNIGADTTARLRKVFYLAIQSRGSQRGEYQNQEDNLILHLTAEGYSKLENPKAEDLLARLQLHHIDFIQTIPFTFFALNSSQVYIKEWIDAPSGKRIFHLIFVNQLMPSGKVEFTDFFLANGQHYAYGNAIIETPSRIQLLFRVPHEDEVKRAKGLSHRLYEARLRLWERFIPKDGFFVVSPGQFESDVKAIPFYSGLGFQPENSELSGLFSEYMQRMRKPVAEIADFDKLRGGKFAPLFYSNLKYAKRSEMRVDVTLSTGESEQKKLVEDYFKNSRESYIAAGITEVSVTIDRDHYAFSFIVRLQDGDHAFTFEVKNDSQNTLFKMLGFRGHADELNPDEFFNVVKMFILPSESLSMAPPKKESARIKLRPATPVADIPRKVNMDIRTKTGLPPGVSIAQHRGKRTEQEDILFYNQLSTPIGPLLIFGIFDGNGNQHGRVFAEAVKQEFERVLAEDAQSFNSEKELTFESLELRIKLLFAKVRENIDKKWSVLTSEPGSTASLVLAFPKQQKAFLATLGDSPVIQEDKGLLSNLQNTDHDNDLALGIAARIKEANKKHYFGVFKSKLGRPLVRIVEAIQNGLNHFFVKMYERTHWKRLSKIHFYLLGREVYSLRNDGNRTYIITEKNGLIYSLAATGLLGTKAFDPVVIREPTVKEIDWKGYLLLGSDGIFDTQKDATIIAKTLSSFRVSHEATGEGSLAGAFLKELLPYFTIIGELDNTSVIIIDFDRLSVYFSEKSHPQPVASEVEQEQRSEMRNGATLSRRKFISSGILGAGAAAFITVFPTALVAEEKPQIPLRKGNYVLASGSDFVVYGVPAVKGQKQFELLTLMNGEMVSVQVSKVQVLWRDRNQFAVLNPNGYLRLVPLPEMKGELKESSDWGTSVILMGAHLGNQHVHNAAIKKIRLSIKNGQVVFSDGVLSASTKEGLELARTEDLSIRVSKPDFKDGQVFAQVAYKPTVLKEGVEVEYAQLSSMALKNAHDAGTVVNVDERSQVTRSTLADLYPQRAGKNGFIGVEATAIGTSGAIMALNEKPSLNRFRPSVALIFNELPKGSFARTWWTLGTDTSTGARVNVNSDNLNPSVAGNNPGAVNFTVVALPAGPRNDAEILALMDRHQVRSEMRKYKSGEIHTVAGVDLASVKEMKSNRLQPNVLLSLNDINALIPYLPFKHELHLKENQAGHATLTIYGFLTDSKRIALLQVELVTDKRNVTRLKLGADIRWTDIIQFLHDFYRKESKAHLAKIKEFEPLLELKRNWLILLEQWAAKRGFKELAFQPIPANLKNPRTLNLRGYYERKIGKEKYFVKAIKRSEMREVSVGNLSKDRPLRFKLKKGEEVKLIFPTWVGNQGAAVVRFDGYPRNKKLQGKAEISVQHPTRIFVNRGEIWQRVKKELREPDDMRWNFGVITSRRIRDLSSPSQGIRKNVWSSAESSHEIVIFDSEVALQNQNGTRLSTQALKTEHVLLKPIRFDADTIEFELIPAEPYTGRSEMRTGTEKKAVFKLNREASPPIEAFGVSWREAEIKDTETNREMMKGLFMAGSGETDPMHRLRSKLEPKTEIREPRLQEILEQNRNQLSSVQFDQVFVELVAKLNEMSPDAAAAAVAQGFVNSNLPVEKQVSMLIVLAQLLPQNILAKVRNYLQTANPQITQMLESMGPVVEVLDSAETNDSEAVLSKDTVEAMQALWLINPKQKFYFKIFGEPIDQLRVDAQRKVIMDWAIKSGIGNKIGFDIIPVTDKNQLKLDMYRADTVLAASNQDVLNKFKDKIFRFVALKRYSAQNRRLGIVAEAALAGQPDLILKSFKDQLGVVQLSDENLNAWKFATELTQILEQALAIATAA